MSEAVYEGLVILDSNRYARDPAEVSAKFPKIIEREGGEMMVSRLWDERRLAYPIRGQRKGTYWLTYFRLDGEKVSAVNEQAQRTESILRHLVLKVDPRIVDTLVQHAQAAASTDSEGKSDGAEKSGGKSETAAETTAEKAESEESGEKAAAQDETTATE